MMRWLAPIVAALGAAASAQAPRPTLLIVGAPHFANPGRDIGNARVDDVTAPARQREIEAVVARLAAFRPTRVAVEWDASRQDRLDRRYADYRAGRYQLSANEIDQIGLRLAARLGLERVDAVDWSENPPGPESAYDFVAYARAHDMGAEWQALERQIQAQAAAAGVLMACTPVSSWLRRLNTPAYRRANQRDYYAIARFGDPGADWVGAWYARNLRILLNLIRIAPRRDDRVVAIYGAGHGYLLDLQARESGAFALADPLAWLPRSPRDAWTRCPA